MNNQLLVSIVLVFGLAGCGGGGGGGSDGDDRSVLDPIREAINNPVDDSIDETNDEIINPTNNSLRLKSEKRDTDNNGQYDYIREYSYNSNGFLIQIVETRYDDGYEPDYEWPGNKFNTVKREFRFNSAGSLDTIFVYYDYPEEIISEYDYLSESQLYLYLYGENGEISSKSYSNKYVDGSKFLKLSC